MTPLNNFSSGIAGLADSTDLLQPKTTSEEHLDVGRKAAALIIDSGALGDGPYTVQVAGALGATPGSSNQVTVTVTTIVPPEPAPPA